MLTRRAARELDALCVKEYGLPSICLMENAGRELALLARDAAPHALAVCGPGNNGGDGLAAARHLHNMGVSIAIALACDPSSLGGDAGVQLGVARRMGIPLHTPPTQNPEAWLARVAPARGSSLVVLDCLFGTGLSRAIEEPHHSIVAAMNALADQSALVLAADIPSGLDADTGEVLGIAVRARMTLTFAAPKPGLLAPRAAAYVGEVRVADIGAPRGLIARLARHAG